MISPISFALILFCLGILMEKFISIPFFSLFLISIIFLILAVIKVDKKFYFILFISIAIFLFGALTTKENNAVCKNHFSNFIKQGYSIILSGVVKSKPVLGKYYNKTFSLFMLKTDWLYYNDQWLKTTGLVNVINYKTKDVFDYGDELFIKGEIGKTKRLPILKVKKTGFIKLTAKGKGNSLIKTILIAKDPIRKLIDTNIARPNSDLLAGILLGDRHRIPEHLNKRFKKTGTIHILAISGLHIGLVASVLFLVFSALGIPKNINSVIIILFLIIYCFFTGSRVPVVRATIMFSLFLLSFLLKKENQIYNTLSIAALIILIWNPNQIYNVGFQLSFAAVFSIIYLTPRFEKFFKRPSYFGRLFFVSLSAWLGVAPLIAFYFKIFSPIAILANLIIIPLLFLNIASGITFISFGLMHPFLASFFAPSCWFFSQLLIISTTLFYRVPYGFFEVPRPAKFLVLFYYGCLFGLAGKNSLKKIRKTS